MNQPTRRDPAQLAQIVEIWKKTVDVQQHFNDLEMRIRNYALTLYAAVIGAGGVALQSGIVVILPILPILVAVGLLAVFILLLRRTSLITTSVAMLAAAVVAAGIISATRTWMKAGSLATPLGAFLLWGGLLAWLAFYFMDKYWYHRLLMGAVLYGSKLEGVLRSTLEIPSFELPMGQRKLLDVQGLTDAIGKTSPVPYGKKELHTDQKMTLFYGTLAAILALLAFAASFAAPAPSKASQQTIRVESWPTAPIMVQTSPLAGSAAGQRPGPAGGASSLERQTTTSGR